MNSVATRESHNFSMAKFDAERGYIGIFGHSEADVIGFTDV